MKKVAMIGVGKLGQDCAEVMSEHYDVVGYDVEPRTPAFPMASSIQAAVQGRDIIFIAAPTAHDPAYGGETPTSHLEVKDFDYSVVTGILQEVNRWVNQSQLVVLISTTLPGTVRAQLRPCITNARFIYNPYLIAMGTIKWDMVNPEMVIIGTETGTVTGDAQELIDFYRVFMKNDPRYEVGTWDEAESIKIFYNTFISAKIALVNMIQDVAEANGNINVDVVTQALAKSTHRIMGPAYMTAGMGDGGACHPRDNIALRWMAEKYGLGYDLFDSIMRAREVQARKLAEKCLSYGTNVTIIGKAYKPGVPYTNGSSSLLVGHYIQELGGVVRYYDPNTGDVDMFRHSTDVYMIGYWENWVRRLNLPPSATVVDPWRKMTSDQHQGEIVYYGAPGKKKLSVPDKLAHVEASDRGKIFNQWFPELAPHQSRIQTMYMGSTTGLVPFSTRNIHDVVNQIKCNFWSGQTHVIFNCQHEPLNSLWLNYVHRLAKLLPEIPGENFFFITGAIDAQQDYENFVRKHHVTKPIKILPLHGWELYIRNNLEGLLKYNPVVMSNHQYVPQKCEKLFLSFNRRLRPQRIKLMAHFFDKGWVDTSYVSFASSVSDGHRTLNDPGLKLDEYTREQINLNKHRLPLNLNMTQNRQNPIDIIADDMRFFRNSYLSVVTETLYEQVNKHGDWEEFDSVFFSEKIFKPIAMKHPFILVSRPGALARLRSLGYRTFAPFIDESYDLEQSGAKRMELIVQELSRLAAFTDEQWLEWQAGVKENVDHNYVHMLGRKQWHDIPDLLTYCGLA